MGTYQKLAIYYFSGTGNSKNVALWMSSVASKNNIVSEIINIATIDRLSIATPSPGALIVFISPTHGFNYPPVMLHFIARFPKGKNKVILMNTRAGMLIGKFIVPGLTGAAFLLSAFVLKLKGYSITGTMPVDLPSNWISLHPGLNERTVKYLHEKNKEKVTAFAEKVISGNTCFKASHEHVVNIIISPVAIGYYFVGRFVFAKSFYASSACNHCDLCIRNCPVKAIVKIDNRPYWTFNCESCMNCMGHCPQRSIETAHGFVIGYILYSSALTSLFFKYFNQLFFKVEHGVVKFVMDTLLYLFFLGLFYFIIHCLMRFKFIERLMVYTSLTKYKFWGRRYKALTEI
jgi:Pyruvate/2-oxoacid:ferredoxin oxidoreductase delta subunit